MNTKIILEEKIETVDFKYEKIPLIKSSIKRSENVSRDLKEIKGTLARDFTLSCGKKILKGSSILIKDEFGEIHDFYSVHLFQNGKHIDYHLG